MISNKRCLIVGGAGSIGQELVRQLSLNNKIMIFDQDETRTFDLAEELQQKGLEVYYRIGDMRDRETVHDIFSDFKPQIVVNAGALKHVTPSQVYPREYVMTNIIGNLNLIEESKRWECLEKYVFISTDKVASENKCVMGATKECSETITVALGYIAVRFGNVLASRGSVLEIWERQFKSGEPLTITDPQMTRYFMTIPQAVKLVIQAIEKGNAGNIMILDMGKKRTIMELKEELYGDYPTKIIGVRPGELMTEELMSNDEKLSAKREGEFYVI
jgi:FlaA1/EpsC-like NDP-sugar epimerase